MHSRAVLLHSPTRVKLLRVINAPSVSPNSNRATFHLVSRNWNSRWRTITNLSIFIVLVYPCTCSRGAACYCLLNSSNIWDKWAELTSLILLPKFCLEANSKIPEEKISLWFHNGIHVKWATQGLSSPVYVIFTDTVVWQFSLVNFSEMLVWRRMTIIGEVSLTARIASCWRVYSCENCFRYTLDCTLRGCFL
jgi:hypothetical protein